MGDLQKLNGYHVFLAIITFLGWTISAMDTSLFFFIAPHLMEEFHFSLQEFGYIVGGGFIIAIVFSVFVGPLTDYFGRKIVFQCVLFLVTISTFLSGLSWNFTSLVVFRLLATGSAFAEYAVGATLLIESVPAKDRGWLVGIMAAGWPAGTALSTLISLYSVPNFGWRSSFFIAAIPAFLIIAIRLFVKEPILYKNISLLHNKGKKPPQKSSFDASEIQTNFKLNKRNSIKFTYRQLLRGDLLKNTVLIWIYMNSIVISYGLLIWFAPYWMNKAFGLDLVQATWLSGIGSLIGIIGYITCGWLSGKIGILEANIIFLPIAMVLTIFMTKFSDTYLSFFIAYLLWSFFGTGTWGAIPRLFTEAFPTHVRGTGASINSASCWLGWALVSTFSPFIINFVEYKHLIFFSGVILFPIALTALWMMRRIPSSVDLEDYTS
jgi:MFS transporter, putative metabolite:H+ symporter